jgi:phage N-6-adenine-methyltransferase
MNARGDMELVSERRSCEACGASLAGRSARARFCGATCRSRAHRRPEAPGPALWRRCGACGERFEAPTRRRRWCSSRCRKRAARGIPRSVLLSNLYDIEARDLWRTPTWLFAELDREFRFGLDAAAAGPSDALCPRHLTPEDDALASSWRAACDPAHPTAFCNPPYSRRAGGLLAWAEAMVRARDEGLVVVAVVPPAPDTRYHRLLHREAVELRYLPRLAFLHPDTGQAVSGNRGGSMVAVLTPGRRGPAAPVYIEAR